jgi:hypothetical protein
MNFVPESVRKASWGHKSPGGSKNPDLTEKFSLKKASLCFPERKTLKKGTAIPIAVMLIKASLCFPEA